MIETGGEISSAVNIKIIMNPYAKFKACLLKGRWFEIDTYMIYWQLGLYLLKRIDTIFGRY